MIGQCAIKQWSAMRAASAHSSAEAELFAASRAIRAAKGLKSLRCARAAESPGEERAKKARCAEDGSGVVNNTWTSPTYSVVVALAGKWLYYCSGCFLSGRVGSERVQH